MLWSLKAEVSATASAHSHDITELILCYGGNGDGDSGHLLMEGRKVNFKTGRTLLIPPGHQHQIMVNEKAPAELKMFCMSDTDMEQFLSPVQLTTIKNLLSSGLSVGDALTDKGTAKTKEPNWNLLELGNQISEGISQPASSTQQLNWSLLSLILALHTNESHLQSVQPQVKNRDHKYHHKMQQVTAWIDLHLQENLGLDQAAAEFGLSRSLFSREFQRHTGKSFIEHCNARRVEKAATVLSTTDMNITEVAFGSGFSNLSHFHRQFKANYGLTPGAFRRKMTEEGSQ